MASPLVVFLRVRPMRPHAPHALNLVELYGNFLSFHSSRARMPPPLNRDILIMSIAGSRTDMSVAGVPAARSAF